MRCLINACRRALALSRVRALEIQLDGMNETMQTVACSETRLAISVARITVRRELAEARAAYIKLLPPGQRRTWSAA